jgi:hypothetical protein
MQTKLVGLEIGGISNEQPKNRRFFLDVEAIAAWLQMTQTRGLSVD